MANEPQDYNSAFSEDVNAMESVPDADAQGHPTIPGMSYVDTVHPSNPDHVFCHGVSDLMADTPIPAKYLRKPDSWRCIFTLPKYLNLMSDNGHAPLDSVHGGGFFSGPISSVTFRLASVSGSTVVLYCANAENIAVDPRSVTTWSGVTRDSIFDPYEGISEAGCFPAPLVGVRFHGCVIEERVRPLILYPDFSGMPDTVANTDTFTIVVNQDCTNADIKLDDSIPVTVELIAEYQQPESWPEIHDQYAFPMVELIRVAEATEWSVDGTINLNDNTAAPCGVAFPNRTKGHIWGTFQVEVSSDGGTNYSDVTSQFEENGWPRFVIIGKADTGLTTYLHLEPIDEDARDYTGYTHIRLRYMYPVANTGIENARVPQQQMCANSQRDYMNWVGDKSTIGAKDIDPEGNHWFCRKHREIPAGNAANYTWNCQETGAVSCGGCPHFSRKTINIVDQGVIGQITSGQGYVLKQSAPGANTVMDQVWNLLSASGIIWQLTPRTAYESNYDLAYTRRMVHYSGGFCMVDETDPHYTAGSDVHIKFVRGALWNYEDPENNFSDLDWDTNRFPAKVFGILARRIPEIMMALTQYSEERDGTNDPNNQIYSERLGRKIALGHRDAGYEGTDLAYSARATAGIEGENRPQRLITCRKFVSGVVKAQAGRQGNTGSDYITVYPTPRTIAGVANVRAVIQLRARGKQNYGYKRIGGAGINGQVWTWADIGGGLFALHAAPGRWNATYIDGGTGERFTVDVPFYAGGNCAQITPPHFAPDGAVDNNPNNVLVNGAHGKAVRGDTIEFFEIPALAGMQFLIDQVYPCGGDTFSGSRAGVQVMHIEAVGSFLRFDEFQENNSTITPTDEETKFTGTVGTYESVGVGAIIEVLNSDRPYTATEDPLDTPRLFRDFHIDYDEAQYADIAAIYQGGDGHTVIEFTTAPGLTVGKVINLRTTPNSGESDGNHTITGIASPTIFVTHREDLSPAGEGATGQWIEVKAGSMVQVGSGRMYPSFPVFGWIASRIDDVLVLSANKIRVSFDVDGIPQTPKELTITTPHADLPYAASAINNIQLKNRITGAVEDMVYAGVSANPFDLFTGESYLNFKYNPTLRRIYFHWATTGDHVIITYTTSDSVNLDGLGEPGSYQRDFQQITDTAYLKKLDLLHIVDSNGILAAQPAGTFDNAQFKISGGLAAKEVTAIGHSPSGEATWTALAAEHWVHCQALNQTFLLDTALALLPDEFNLYLDGTFADHSFNISAEFMQMLLKCIGCLDTIPFGLEIHDLGISVSLTGYFNYGFTNITPNSGFETADSHPNGDPNTRGLYDFNLPTGLGPHAADAGLLRISGALAGSHHIYQIAAGQFWLGTYTPAVDGPAFEIGVSGDGNNAAMHMNIYEIKFPLWLRKVPDDVEIVDAAIEVYLPPDSEILTAHTVLYQAWDSTQTNVGGNGYGGLDLPHNPAHGDEASSATVETTMPGGFGLIGFDPALGDNGAWVALGGFQDVDGGELVVGAWRPIKANALFEKLRGLKPSRFSKLALYLAPVPNADAEVTTGLDGAGYEEIGIMEQIINTYIDFNGAAASDDDYRFEWTTRYLTMENPVLYGAGFVKFRLPTGQLATVRLQPGDAFPDMRPA